VPFAFKDSVIERFCNWYHLSHFAAFFNEIGSQVIHRDTLWEPSSTVVGRQKRKGKKKKKGVFYASFSFSSPIVLGFVLINERRKLLNIYTKWICIYIVCFFLFFVDYISKPFLIFFFCAIISIFSSFTVLFRSPIWYPQPSIHRRICNWQKLECLAK